MGVPCQWIRRCWPRFPAPCSRCIGNVGRSSPPQVQEALTTAAALSRTDDPVPAFLPDIIARAASFMTDPEEMAKGLALAADPAAWTIVSEQVNVFREQLLADQARNEINLDPDDATELRDRAVAELRLWITEHLDPPYWLAPDPANSLAAEWLLDLNPARFDTPADVAAAWQHSRDVAAAHQLLPAAELLQAALPYTEPEHPHTLAMRAHVASWLSDAGQVKEATAQYRTLLTDRERVLGPDHPDTLTSRNNLAEAWWSAGDLGRAIPLFEQTLTGSERVLGPDHPDTLASRNNLAETWRSAGDLGRAIPLYEQTLTDSERVLGPDHPQTLASRNNLAYAWQSAGDLGRAIPLFEQTLTDCERVLGPDHPDTLTSRNNLAYAWQSAGDLGRAIPLYEQTLTDRERVLGPDHPQTLASRNNLAYAWQSAGDLGRAIPLFEQTLTDRERVLGPDHPDTLTSRNNLAHTWWQHGSYANAFRTFEEAAASALRLFGPDHEVTRQLVENRDAASRMMAEHRDT